MAPATDGGDILEQARSFKPGLVLLDFDLGAAVGTGLALVAPLAELGARVVMLSGTMDRRALAECVEAGAVGFVDKARPFETLLDSVARAVERGTLLAAGERDDLLAELRTIRGRDRSRLAPFEQLTPREREVLAALLEGRAAETIARHAVVSVATVRSQIRSILVKLGVNSQLEAVAAARRGGWSPPV